MITGDDARLAAERRPDEARDERADAGAEQRHADEVRRDQDQRADHAADQRRADHPERVLGAHRGAGEERAEDEPVESRGRRGRRGSRRSTKSARRRAGRSPRASGRTPGSIARRLYDGDGVPDSPAAAPRSTVRPAVCSRRGRARAARVGGAASVGPARDLTRLPAGRLGPRLISCSAALRFAARAAAWWLCLEPPHRLRFATRSPRSSAATRSAT